MKIDRNTATDPRLTAWEVAHEFVRTLSRGQCAAAALVSKLGARAGLKVAYRLCSSRECRKRAAKGLSYNALMQGLPEIVRLANESGRAPVGHAGPFAASEE